MSRSRCCACPFGDLRLPAELTGRLPRVRRELLLARIALAGGDHHAAQEHLRAVTPGGLTPRLALIRQLLVAATAIERGDPAIASILGWRSAHSPQPGLSQHRNHHRTAGGGAM